MNWVHREVETSPHFSFKKLQSEKVDRSNQITHTKKKKGLTPKASSIEYRIFVGFRFF